MPATHELAGGMINDNISSAELHWRLVNVLMACAENGGSGYDRRNDDNALQTLHVSLLWLTAEAVTFDLPAVPVQIKKGRRVMPIFKGV